MPFIISMKYVHGRSGCNPPTMWTSRDHRWQRRHFLEHGVEAHRVAPGIARPGRERAEVARRDADVRVVDVGIADEVRGVAMPLLTYVIGKSADAEEVRGLVQRHPVVEVQALAPKHLVANSEQRRVAGARLRQ